MVGWLVAITTVVRDRMDESEAAYQAYAQACPYVRARAKARDYYARAQAAVQALRTKTQVKEDCSPVAAPTPLAASLDDACRSHVKSFLECVDMHNDDHYSSCKFYLDTMRECAE